MHSLLLEELRKRYPLKSKAEIETLAGVVTYPSQHTPLFNSQLSLLAIINYIQKKKVKSFKKNPEVQKMTATHLQKFGHIPVNFNEDPWSLNDVHNQLQELLKIDCAKEIRAVTRSHQNMLKKRNKILCEINNKKTSQIALSLQIGTTLNEYRKNVFSRASLAYRPLFQECARKYRLFSWKEIWQLTPVEIERLYYDGDASVLKALSHRDPTGLTYASNAQGYKIIPLKTIKLFLKDVAPLKKEAGRAIKEVSGMIANPGKIRGVARVILGRTDFHKFKNNDIIVSNMTSVDFVPIMKRASAFVTDEGGISSHASIISRELGKPCIIGTKIGTKVFKDGDRVEVDAEKGIVRKIK
jgi:phosphoenolpyruvate synthase/pyruvate phosphate dikinase